MGSSQAAGRAIVGYLSPPARTAEFFGLWGLAVKAASIFGPLTYGAVTWIFEGNHRLGILAVGAYFVVGLDPAHRHRRRARKKGSAHHNRLGGSVTLPLLDCLSYDSHSSIADSTGAANPHKN